jgi:hypothetical protein
LKDPTKYADEVGKLGRIAVGALTTDDLLGFRSGLVDKELSAGTVNRICIALRAALNLAAKADSRITNRNAWKDGLEAVAGDEDSARNVILEEPPVRAIIASSYRQSDERLVRRAHGRDRSAPEPVGAAAW